MVLTFQLVPSHSTLALGKVGMSEELYCLIRKDLYLLSIYLTNLPETWPINIHRFCVLRSGLKNLEVWRNSLILLSTFSAGGLTINEDVECELGLKISMGSTVDFLFIAMDKLLTNLNRSERNSDTMYLRKIQNHVSKLWQCLLEFTTTHYLMFQIV